MALNHNDMVFANSELGIVPGCSRATGVELFFGKPETLTRYQAILLDNQRAGGFFTLHWKNKPPAEMAFLKLNRQALARQSRCSLPG